MQQCRSFCKASLAEFEKITHELLGVGDTFQWQKLGRNRAYLWQVLPVFFSAFHMAENSFQSPAQACAKIESEQLQKYRRRKANFRVPENEMKGRKAIIDFFGVIAITRAGNSGPLPTMGRISYTITHHAVRKNHFHIHILKVRRLAHLKVVFAAG